MKGKQQLALRVGFPALPSNGEMKSEDALLCDTPASTQHLYKKNKTPNYRSLTAISVTEQNFPWDYEERTWVGQLVHLLFLSHEYCFLNLLNVCCTYAKQNKTTCLPFYFILLLSSRQGVLPFFIEPWDMNHSVLNHIFISFYKLRK